MIFQESAPPWHHWNNLSFEKKLGIHIILKVLGRCHWNPHVGWKLHRIPHLSSPKVYNQVTPGSFHWKSSYKMTFPFPSSKLYQFLFNFEVLHPGNEMHLGACQWQTNSSKMTLCKVHSFLFVMAFGWIFEHKSAALLYSEHLDLHGLAVGEPTGGPRLCWYSQGAPWTVGPFGRWWALKFESLKWLMIKNGLFLVFIFSLQ